MSRVPLFITNYSLSSKTAIGVQTKHLMKGFPGAKHAYWSRFTVEADPAMSTRLEHAAVSRLGFLKGDSTFGRATRALGLSWWNGDRLAPRRERWVRKNLADRVSSLYLAPLDRSDAAKMRHLVEILGRPFLLHYWDSLDGAIGDDPNHVWLIRHASRVMAISEPIVDEVRALGVEADILLFTRPAPDRGVRPEPPTEDLRIGLVGDVLSYMDGMAVLDEAVGFMRAKGRAVEMVYVGRPTLGEQANARMSNKMALAGFLSDAERDATLLKCHLGYLPGPRPAPVADYRSRYSIPSRTLDFLGLGLPLVGTVHPDSGTARFLRSLGLTEAFAYERPASLAERFESLLAPEVWHAAAAESERAFERFLAEDPVTKLRSAMSTLDR